MVLIFLVFEGLWGYPAISVYYYCSWDVFIFIVSIAICSA